MSRAQELIDRGVVIPHRDSVFIGEEVNPDHLEPGTVIHPGCRITGAQSSIGPRCILGAEAPLTLSDCQLDEAVELAGGFAAGAVFLAGASLGSCAHVRPGTILEEQASGGHCVGLKQTHLMPFVTTGSLINFCDALMAGGTDRRNHSEIGSSFVHFNYTPHKDKATASLVGDVPRGVMLDQPPIFLGGQGGMVGPRRVEFGTIVAAGTICRHDIATGGTLVYGQFGRAAGKMDYTPGLYGDIRHIVNSNLRYLGNLLALRAWYRYVRAVFLERTPHGRRCLEGAVRQIDAMLDERMKRMDELAGKMPASLRRAEERAGERPTGAAYEGQAALVRLWPGIADALGALRSEEFAPQADHPMSAALAADASRTSEYIEWVQSLAPEARTTGSQWLESIVQQVMGLWSREKGS